MKRFVFRFFVFIIGAIIGASIIGLFISSDSIWSSIAGIVTGGVAVYIYIQRIEPLELI